MTTKEFATNLASLLRKRAVIVRSNDERDAETSTAIACALGSLADDIENLANSMPSDNNTSRKGWEYLG